MSGSRHHTRTLEKIVKKNTPKSETDEQRKN